MDSYQKYAQDLFGVIDTPKWIFQHVHPDDLDEMVVNFAVLVGGLDCSDNYRIFPLHMGKEFKTIANKGCCGSVNHQYKCLSGRIYWAGCNYGH